MACPICRKETDPRHRPFCSRRCADIDLGRWLTGGYVIPGDTPDDGDISAPASTGDGPDAPRNSGRPRGH